MTTKPLVTIDLEEYNRLMEVEKKYNNPEGEIPKEDMELILGGLVSGFSEHGFERLNMELKNVYGVAMVVDMGVGGTRMRFKKIK